MNIYRMLKGILPDAPLQVGTVAGISNGTATITLPGGGILNARGEATVGDTVFVRDGVIEGPAPDLPDETIEI